jgi:hypothetical protein
MLVYNESTRLWAADAVLPDNKEGKCFPSLGPVSVVDFVVKEQRKMEHNKTNLRIMFSYLVDIRKMVVQT